MGKRPIVTLTIAFAVGIGLVAGTGTRWVLLLFVLPIVAILSFLAWRTKRPAWVQAAWLTGTVALGMTRFAAVQGTAPNDVSRLAPHWATLIGTVVSDVDTAAEMESGASSGTESGQALRPLILAARYVVVPPQSSNALASVIEKPTTKIQSDARLLPVSGQVAVRVPILQSTSDTNGNENDATENLRYGATVWLRGRLELPSGPRNPDAFDYRAYLAHRNIHTTLAVLRPADWQTLPESGGIGNPWLPAAFAMRHAVLQHGRATQPMPLSAVLSGILLGDHFGLPPDLQSDFQRTGTAHVLATAGLHIGIVTGLLFGLFRVLRVPRKPALILMILALALFAAGAGGRPAVIRAVLVADICLFGIFLDREPNFANALSLAAWILLLWNPFTLLDPGFQYSFCAVISIVLLMPFGQVWLERLHQRLPAKTSFDRVIRAGVVFGASCFLLALAAQVGVTPLVAYYEHMVTSGSVVANAFVVPAVVAILTLGWPAIALGTVSLALSWPLDKLLTLLLAYSIGVVRLCSNLPGACWPLPSFPLPLVVVYYALLWYAAWKWCPATRPLEMFAVVRHLFGSAPDDAESDILDNGDTNRLTGAIRAER